MAVILRLSLTAFLGYIYYLLVPRVFVLFIFSIVLIVYILK